MWQFETEVGEVIQRTPSIRSFRFPIRAGGVRYRPGQFFFVTIRLDDREGVHHFSFSSSPTEKGYLEFTKRITQSEYSQALARLKPGDWARLRGPFGNFTLPEKPQKLAFLTGGIGVTPQRSMLRYIASMGLPFDIAMLYGNQNWEEICFRDELKVLTREIGGFRLEDVLANPPTRWEGMTGAIDDVKIAQSIPDYADRLFYISGPPSMVMAMEDHLRSLGLAQERWKRDAFTGYD